MTVRRIFLAAGLLALAAFRPALAADPFEPKSHRWEEDYAWMASRPAPEALGERIKFLALTPDRTVWLTLGGEVRQRVDSVHDSQVGLSAFPDAVSATTRAYLHADAHFGDRLRVFGQLSYADEGGRKGPDRSFDESAPDVQQLFADVTLAKGARLRLGRQELPLGDQRLSEVRETYNLRRSFDAVRLDLQAPGEISLTAFDARLVINRPEAFDDKDQPGETFRGLYLAAHRQGLDLFWLERCRRASTYAEGTAPERRETFGARLHQDREPFDYNLYAVGQTGAFGGRDIRAWAVSADMGWTFPEAPWRPRLSLRADAASGDHQKGDGRLETFDAPYPNTSYLSTSSAYWPGNAWSVFPLVTARPREDLTVYVGAQSMSRMSKADGFYYTAQSPLALPPGHGQTMMRQVYTRAKWEPRRGLAVSVTLIRQFAGDAARARGGRDGSIISLATDWKF